MTPKEGRDVETMFFHTAAPRVLSCWWFQLGLLLVVVAAGVFVWMCLVIQLQTEQLWQAFQRILESTKFSHGVQCDQCYKVPPGLPVMKTILVWAVVPPSLAITVWGTIRFFPNSHKGPSR